MEQTGELRHIKKLRYWPLESVLHDKYLFPKLEADALASFLTPMLRLHPDKRAKASELTHHNWLDGVVVQGEIDVIRRMEIDEAARRRAITSGEQTREQSSSRSREREGLDLSERDAMKPFDESVLINGEDDGDDVDDHHHSHHPQQHHPPVLGAPPQPAVSQHQSGHENLGSGIARALQQADTTATRTPPRDINSNNIARPSSSGKKGSTSTGQGSKRRVA